jgi:cell division septum initiation protein DivIVA
MLLNEVQKQRARIEELEARLARLESALRTPTVP